MKNICFGIVLISAITASALAGSSDSSSTTGISAVEALLVGEWHYFSYNATYRADHTFSFQLRPDIPPTHRPEAGTWQIVKGKYIAHTYSDDGAVEERQLKSVTVSRLIFDVSGDEMMFTRVGKTNVTNVTGVEQAAAEYLTGVDLTARTAASERDKADAAKQQHDLAAYAEKTLWSLQIDPEVSLSPRLQKMGAKVELVGPGLSSIRDAFAQKDWPALTEAVASASKVTTVEFNSDKHLNSMQQVDQMRQELIHGLRMFVRLKTGQLRNALYFLAFNDPHSSDDVAPWEAVVSADDEIPQFIVGSGWRKFPDGDGYTHPYAIGTKQIIIFVGGTSYPDPQGPPFYNLSLQFQADVGKLVEKQRLGLMEESVKKTQLRILQERYRNEIKNFTLRH